MYVVSLSLSLSLDLSSNDTHKNTADDTFEQKSTKSMILETVESLNKINDFTKFHFTSAKTGENVKDVIRSILSVIDKKRRVLRERNKKKLIHKKKKRSSKRHRRTAIVERNHSSSSILRSSKSSLLSSQEQRPKSATVVSVTSMGDVDGDVDVEVLSSTECEDPTFLDQERVVLQASTCTTGCGTMSSGCC